MAQFAVACTTYYQISQLTKGLDKATTHNNEVVAKARSDYQQKQTIYDTLASKTSDPNMPPYPEFSQRLKGLHEKLLLLEQKHRTLEEIHQRFHDQFEGIERIEEGSEHWRQFRALQEVYNNATDAMEQAAKSYQNSSNELASLLNRYQVNRINPPLLNQKINNYLTKLDKTIDATEQQLSEYQQQLNDYRLQGGNDQFYKARATTVDELEKILDRIIETRRNISNLHNNFVQEIGDKEKQWVGPGMASHRLLDKITLEGSSIESLQDEFLKLSKQL